MHVEIVEEFDTVQISSKNGNGRRQKNDGEGEYGNVGIENEEKGHIPLLLEMPDDDGD